jgi:hypothetical protein
MQAENGPKIYEKVYQFPQRQWPNRIHFHRLIVPFQMPVPPYVHAVFAHQNGPGYLHTLFSKTLTDGFDVPARLRLAGERKAQCQAGLRRDAMIDPEPEREPVLINMMDPQELDTILGENKVRYER